MTFFAAFEFYAVFVTVEWLRKYVSLKETKSCGLPDG